MPETPPPRVDPLAETIKIEREVVILYGTRVSPFVEKVARALQWKRIPFELVPPTSRGDLSKWNPQTGKMPVADIRGERFIDSTRILRELDLIQPEPSLFSKNPAAAASQRLLEDWADESLYWLRAAIQWANPRQAADRMLENLPVPTFLHPVLRPLLMRQFGGLVKAQGFGRLPIETLRQELAQRCDDLVALLGSRGFFFGDHPSAGDLAVFAMLHFEVGPPLPDFDRALADRPLLSEWKDRVAATTTV